MDIELILLYGKFFLDIVKLILFGISAYVQWIVQQFLTPVEKSLVNEIILVTGAGSGIGKEICLEIGKREKSLTLVCWDIDENGNESTVEELKHLGVKAVYGHTVNVADRIQVQNAALKVRKEIGDVSILVNNAGIVGEIGPLWKLKPENICKTFDVNVFSHFWILQEFLPPMLKNYNSARPEVSKKGHIVTVSSGYGLIHTHSFSAYIASKHAVHGYIESLKEDIRGIYGEGFINFTSVYPHIVDTPMAVGIDVKSKYPFLSKGMSSKFCGQRIVRGILQNEESIIGPGFIQYVAMLRAILLPSVYRKSMDVTGLTIMDKRKN